MRNKMEERTNVVTELRRISKAIGWLTAAIIFAGLIISWSIQSLA